MTNDDDGSSDEYERVALTFWKQRLSRGCWIWARAKTKRREGLRFGPSGKFAGRRRQEKVGRGRESEKDRRERQDIENEYGWVLFARHLGQSESHKCTVPHLFRSPHLCACVLASRSVKSRWIGDSIERTSQTKPEKKERRKSEKKKRHRSELFSQHRFPGILVCGRKAT